jgi:hypothetical protein
MINLLTDSTIKHKQNNDLLYKKKKKIPMEIKEIDDDDKFDGRMKWMMK